MKMVSFWGAEVSASARRQRPPHSKGGDTFVGKLPYPTQNGIPCPGAISRDWSVSLRMLSRAASNP